MDIAWKTQADLWAEYEKQAKDAQTKFLAEMKRQSEEKNARWRNRVISDTEKLANKCPELGWILHKRINVHQLKVMAEWIDEKSEYFESNIDEIFLTIFNEEEVRNIYNDWSKKGWLKSRIPVLGEVIETHIDGKYFVSIPAILTQIEGMIFEGYGYREWTDQKILKGYTKELLKDYNGWFDAIMNPLIDNFLRNILLKSFNGFGDKLEFPFINRHAILHGSFTDYGNAANSLKCILLFDYLQDQFQYVSKPDEMLYHTMECPLIKENVGVRTVYPHLEFAQQAGKLPCTLCIEENLKS